MRDIVSASYNHTPKSNTLNKNEYKDFLENYSDNKNSKDDVESVSSTDSGVSSYKLLESKSNNTSTSSLNSDVNGTTNKFFSKAEPTPAVIMGGRTGSFRNYMENYTHKKFGSVKPIIANKPSLIKSEIVIQVNDPLEAELTPKIETVLVRRDSPPEPTKRFSPPPPPPPPPLIQVTNNCIPPPPPMLLGCSINQGKKWATVETETSRSSNNEPPKVPKNNIAAANLAKILNEHVLARRKISDTESPNTNNIVTSVVANDEASHVKSVQNTPNTNGNIKASTLPRQERKSPSLSPPKLQSPKLPESVHSKFSQHSPPSPPKLPTSKVLRTNLQKPINGLNCNIDSVDYCTTTVVPVTEGTTTVNKGDANVKKLVYNTYRGLLGAYNNKANDMISTLPRNMVREDKGVAKQVQSMGLQCRLEKLNGRINPKLEQE